MVSKSKKVEIGIKGEPDTFQDIQRETPVLESPKLEEDKDLRPAIVVSSLDHQVILSYDGESMVVPPRGRQKVFNLDKLGAKPKGITVIPIY